MYEHDAPEAVRYSEPVMAEDKRVDLMRQFVSLSDDLDRMREQRVDLEERQSALTKERERVRRDLDSVINPDKVPTMAASVEAYR